ncbi:MAG: hemerythrin protein [Noviherbaspirillum sp.]|nr:hemerythrin protein [Noviherbaspirillum sp.]
MPTATTDTASTRKPAAKAPAKKAAVKLTDAIAILKDDHKNVKKLFKDFDKMKDKAEDSAKEALVKRICTELTIHAQIEEEIFYPAARKAIGDEDLLDEATVEHASAKDLIRQLQSMAVSDPLYDAKVTVLGEYVDHHVQEEQDEMFKKAKKAKMDMEKLGRKLATRKRALMKEMTEGTLAA